MVISKRELLAHGGRPCEGIPEFKAEVAMA